MGQAVETAPANVLEMMARLAAKMDVKVAGKAIVLSGPLVRTIAAMSMSADKLASLLQSCPWSCLLALTAQWQQEEQALSQLRKLF